MNDFRRLNAPAGDGETLIAPAMADVPSLLKANQFQLNQSSIIELRKLARQEFLPGIDLCTPVIVTGHQPELCHPGVWLKTFEVDRLAKSLNAKSLNLIVDTDEIKSLSIKVPRYSDDPSRVRIDTVPFDTGPADTAYEFRTVEDTELFASFGERAGFDQGLWKIAVETPGTIGEKFVAMRSAREREWGCDVPTLVVSSLAKSESFQSFASLIFNDLDRFIEIHNNAVRAYRVRAKLKSRTHPVPELKPREAPFWALVDGRRRPATSLAQVRPRALTLTLFARLVLSDWFVHGLGGGKYDAVTDDIIRNFFGIEPPSFQVVTGTLRLPFKVFPNEGPREWIRRSRDLTQNPQRYAEDLPAHVREMSRQLQLWIAAPTTTKALRKERRAAINQLKSMLSVYTESMQPPIESQIVASRQTAVANEILRRRDFAWPLFDPVRLKEFLVGRNG